MAPGRVRHSGWMSSSRPHRAAPIDLWDYSGAWEIRAGRPPKHDLADWRVIDDWPEQVPVNPEEIDVFDRWFSDIIDELFGPS